MTEPADEVSLCLVTPRHISYNPRLVKEADALHEAGYAVRVAATTLRSGKQKLDGRLMQERAWRLGTVDARRLVGLPGLRWLKNGVRQKLYRSSEWLRRRPWGMARAHSRHVDELAALAAAEPADLYVAHNLQALPAAYRAVQQHDALLGFDAEDFHRGQFPPGEESLAQALTSAVEERYLPHCHHLTAASDGIAAAYADAVGVQRPQTVLNVFSLDERHDQVAPAALEREKPRKDGISLYWYSQKIGPDRGMQDAVRALGLLDDERVHLVLRGEWADSFEAELMEWAERCGVARRVYWRAPAPPEQLIERAAQHDIGLALEPGKDENNRIAASNKLFAYLLAGVPVVATDTEGQRGICETVPGATRLCSIGSPEALAEAIRPLLSSNETLQKAKQAARQAGTERYNWDREKQKLLKTVDACLGESVPATTEEASS